MGRFATILVLAVFSSTVQSANILALFSSLSYSDHQVFRGYITQLAKAGHNIVLMTAYPGHFTFPDVERIVELDVAPQSGAFWNDWVQLMSNTDDYYTIMKELNEFSVKLAIAQLKSATMQKLLQNPKAQFDLVITEGDVPLLYGAAEKYQAAHIAITTSSGKIHQYEAKGCPTHPILYPDVNTLHYRDASVLQKLSEYIRYIRSKRDYYNYYLAICEVAAKNIFGLKKDLLEIENDIDLLFVASNPILIGNRPTTPAVVFTDRMHINPGFILPQNLKATLDAAKKGVIYFSIGAVQESETLSPHLLQTIASAFGELPFTVLWKIGNTTAINKPDNVISGAWFPQQEVLAHPNVKAFITHGGPRSLEEAVVYEVPIVGLPLVKSRKTFIREITKHGAGEIIDPYTLNKEELKATISAVATQEKYKQAMIKLKSTAINPAISGPEKAMWWTEYVLQQRGAKLLRSPSASLSYFDYFGGDLIILSFVVLMLSAWVSLKVMKKLTRKLRVKIFNARIARDADDRKFKAL